MKKTVLLLCFCMATTAVFAITKDSIIVNVGSKKKVVLYGETKEDLKNLEKIDLNKALKNMNKEMDLMSSKTRRLVVKDYDGNSYSIDSADVHQTPWQKFVKNTYLNLDIGGAINLTWRPNLTERLLPGILQYQSVNPAVFHDFNPNYGLSLMHSSRYILGKRVAFNLKKGFKYDYSAFQTSGLIDRFLGESYYKNFVPVSQTTPGFEWFNNSSKALKELFEKYETVKSTTTVDYNSNYKIESTTSFEDGTKLATTFNPSKNKIHRLSFDLIPTFSLLNKKKQDTFTFGVGMYASKIFSQKQYITQFLKADGLVGSQITGTNQKTNYSDTSLGLHLSVGYKNISFFVRSDLKANQGFVGNQIFDNKGIGLVPVQGQFRMSTIGIRIGR